MRKFIITCCLLVAILIAVFLEYYLSPWKNYFTISLTAVFFIYWAVEFILDFISFKRSYPKMFQYFAVEKVNKLDISLEEIDKNKKKYFAEFKRSIFKERLTFILKILFCIGVALTLIVSLFF